MKGRVLVTGCTSAHHSYSLGMKNVSFSTQLVRALVSLGYVVDQVEPDPACTQSELDAYDRVFVGLASPISVASNSAYGALATIDKAARSKSLVMFIDSPEPSKITAGLRAAQRSDSALFKPFYSKRKFYNEVVNDKKIKRSISLAIDLLLNREWPTTLFPALPWSDDDIQGLPEASRGRLVGLNMDAAYIKATKISDVQATRRNVWAVDDVGARWTTDTVKTLRLPHESMKENKGSTDSDVHRKLSTSLGALICPQRDKNPWWSPRYFQAMNASTPIATDWKLSACVGSAWTHLAAGIEELSAIDRYELAVSQKEQYLDIIPTTNKALTFLQQVV